MRKSLFALENIGDITNTAGVDISPEEGDTASVSIDVSDDLESIAEQADAVNVGTDAAGQLEQVQDLITDANENGGGLDPVAAEALRIAVEAICSRVDADPKVVYSLYAAENFQASSTRKANSGYALEGVGQLAKDFYAKVKAVLSSMWAKINAFWAKHISSLGRVKKALESMKSKVASSSGKFEGRAQLDEAPSMLVDTFPGKGRLNKAAIDKFVAVHRSATEEAQAITSAITTFNSDAANVSITTEAEAKAFRDKVAGKVDGKALGTESSPLVNGVYIEYKIEGDSEEDGFNLVVERNTIGDKDSKREVQLADKGELKTLLDSTLAIINDTIKGKDLSARLNDATIKFLRAAEKKVDQADTDAADKAQIKSFRNVLAMSYKANSKLSTVTSEMLSQNLRLAKGVLGYSSLCLKHYK